MNKNKKTEKRTMKLKTIFGKILTIEIIEQNEIFISGWDLFGDYVKIPLKDIESIMPFGEKEK